MSLSGKVHDAMANNSGVSTLVSTRIYPRKLPQTPTYPAISYQRISGTPQQGSTDLRNPRYQINCWATTDIGAEALANAVVALFEEYTHEVGAPGIKMTEVVNHLDDYDDATKSYRNIVDVIFTTTGE